MSSSPTCPILLIFYFNYCEFVNFAKVVPPNRQTLDSIASLSKLVHCHHSSFTVSCRLSTNYGMLQELANLFCVRNSKSY